MSGRWGAFFLCICVGLLAGCKGEDPQPPGSTTPQVQSPVPANTAEPRVAVDLAGLPVITRDNLGQLQLVDTIMAGEGEVISAFRPGMKGMVTSGQGGSVRLFDLASRSEYVRLDQPGVSLALDFSPDGRMLAVGSSDERVYIWDVETGERLGELTGHTAGIAFHSVDWSPDGKLIAAGSRGDDIWIWDVESGSQIGKLDLHHDEIAGLTFSPDGKTLVSGSFDFRVIFWDVAGKTEKLILDGHESSVNDVVFTPDGDFLISLSGDITQRDNAVHIWDAQTGEHVREMEDHHQIWWGDLSINPEGSLVATSGGFVSDPEVYFYDLADGERVYTLEGRQAGVMSVEFSPDGRLVALGDMDGVVQIYGVMP